MTPSLLSRIAPLATFCMLGLSAPAIAQAPQGAVVIASDEALQWCVAAQRSRDGGFDEVWLAPCTSPAARFTVDGRTGRVRSASRPDLCLSDTTGAGDAPFAAIMRPCDDTSFGHFYLYDRGTRQLASIEASTGRRSRDSLCSFMVPRGPRTQIMNDLCNERRVRNGHSTFVMAPVSAVAAAAAPPPQDPRPAPMAPPRDIQSPPSGGFAAQGRPPAPPATSGAVVISSDEALQWCLAAQRSRDGGLDEVWLAPCTSPAARFTVDGRTGRVRSASRPNLCLSDTTGAGDAPFAGIMRPCDDTSFGNFYLYDRGTRQLASIEADTGRRSGDSLCSFMVPRGQRTQIMNDLCNGRRVRNGHSTFVVAPVSAVAAADAPPPQDPRPAAPAPMAPPPVAADRAPGRSVDCLVVIEGRTYIDGSCEFRSEAGGDFTITSGTRKASVMVDPGSRAGRASFEDTSPRNPQALVWDVTRQGACWVDRSSRICAWSTGQRPQADGGGQGGFAQAPQQWSPPPQAQPVPQQQPATRMIRMDAPPSRFTLAREMRGNRLLRCVVSGPSDEGLQVSYVPGNELRRVLSIPGNRAPEGAEDSLIVTFNPGDGRPVTLPARHSGNRVSADLTDGAFDALAQASSIEVQFGSTGETRSFDVTTLSEVDPAVDGCLTSFGPSQDEQLRRAERDYQRQQAQRPAPQPPVAMAPPTAQGQREAYRFNFARAGVWEVRRLSDEPSGRRTVGCLVDTTDPSANNLRFAVDGRNAIIEFRDGGDMARFPQRFQVQIQFGTNTRSYTFPAQVVDEGFGPWARLMTARTFQSGIENAGELIIRTPEGPVTLPIYDGDRLWPAMARCMAMIR